MMEWFLLDHNSVGRLAAVLLSVLIAGFLFYKRERDSSLRFFAWFFAFSSLYHIGCFIVCTALVPRGAYGWILTAFAPIAMICLIQFAYRFPRRIARRESAVVAVVTVLAIGAGIVDYVWRFAVSRIWWQDFAFGSDYSTQYLPAAAAVLYLWAIIVFLRQSVSVSREHGDRRSLAKVLLLPESKEASTARYFAFAVGAEFILCVLLAVEAVFHSVTPGLMNNLQSSGYLLIYLAYILIYINNAAKPTSLLVKLIGISLVMMFLILTAAGQYGLYKVETAVSDMYQTRTAYEVASYRGGRTAFSSDVMFIVSRPLADGRFGSHFSVHYAHDEKFDLLRLQENESRERDASKGLEIRSSSLRPGRSEDAAFGMKIVEGKGALFFFYSVIEGDSVYSVGYDYYAFRSQLHSVAFAGAILYLLSAAVVIIVFPAVYRRSVFAPIIRIMNAVKRVKEGDLDVELPVKYDDEIGFLTSSFNQMVLSLKTSRKYQDHYSSQLEEAFVKIEISRQEVEDNFSELRRIHGALAESEMRYKMLNAELELRVEDRTSRLEKANAELVTALATLRETQAELIRTEKMAALGDMVAGMAHEINNPLGVAITASSLIDRSMTEIRAAFENGTLSRGELERHLVSCGESSQIIQTNLGRAGELVQSFKLVAADQSSEERRSFDLSDYLRDVLVSLQPKFRKTGHRITVNCGESVPVYSYPGSFSQIITNFAMNSLLHAYPGRNDGRMTIAVRVEDEYLFLVYEDDGCGIESENIDKIFIPFYTTKRQQGGTGLGLHVVYNIVTQKLVGSIDVASRPGEGVRFTIRVPISQLRLPEII